MTDYPPRPQTPQAMLHRLPDKPDPSSFSTNSPSKYLILITASTLFAGKVQIAKSVATALSCPLFQGDSLHETSAKAASVGASRRPAVDGGEASGSGVNEERYQRMWLSKMTRTGLLFPEESRPALSKEGFSGFGGASRSSSMSRRGSESSIASEASEAAASVASVASSFMSSGPPAVAKFVNKPLSTFTLSEKEERMANKALMVITHPELENWHKKAIRKAVGEYGIGVIFVPLGEDGEEEELPILKPLDPRTMMSFGDFGGRNKITRTLDEEIMVSVVGGGNVEDVIEDVVSGVREIIDD
ncbi:hypothetical protein N431DRAFT_433543 [Stipitochalara longipes BDJ]|nr:hypothetical protein N431DRAFT_433543 [Stipitochalara longipes BDJ]